MHNKLNTSFYIVEDDKVVQNILKRIIEKNHLGDIIGYSNDGGQAIEDIKILKPDIVLVDLLLPTVDGIKIVSKVKGTHEDVTFIMISQVSSEEMISKAYKNGIEFFISKPINVIEVISVIEKIKEKVNMSKVIQSFEDALKGIRGIDYVPVEKKNKEHSVEDKIEKVLAQLGILGEAGVRDIIEIILWIMNHIEEGKNNLPKYKLSQIYKYLCDKYSEEEGIATNTSAIEQRVRRASIKALKNIANMGIENGENEIFVKYSSTLFNFKEVRNQMNFGRGESGQSGKVNIKKFIEGIIIDIKDE